MFGNSYLFFEKNIYSSYCNLFLLFLLIHVNSWSILGMFEEKIKFATRRVWFLKASSFHCFCSRWKREISVVFVDATNPLIGEFHEEKKPGGGGRRLQDGLQYFLVSPLPREMIQFDQYFSSGLKPPTSLGLSSLKPTGRIWQEAEVSPPEKQRSSSSRFNPSVSGAICLLVSGRGR